MIRKIFESDPPGLALDDSGITSENGGSNKQGCIDLLERLVDKHPERMPTELRNLISTLGWKQASAMLSQ